MELYIIHRKAPWEFSVKMPFRHLKVENKIPAKSLSFSAFLAQTCSFPLPSCEWICLSMPRLFFSRFEVCGGDHSGGKKSTIKMQRGECGVRGTAARRRTGKNVHCLQQHANHWIPQRHFSGLEGAVDCCNVRTRIDSLEF